MKLVIAIIHDEDSHELIEKLTEKNYGVTKLASTGGFLKSGNTTLLVGTQKEKVDEVISIIKDVCRTRKEITTTSPMIADNSGFMSIPIEITIGGATIFVVDIERVEKV
ncbi:cyclic-di-AMP receptor [Caminicella sporogenes]|uniref:cyclic-di-AMP receptor n=1 Tax=Caminicella sporogenes TaxID=166485 RepID=UPI002541FBDC|nr:cyclic-di-AMP receptor [Caminicella sporogenes]WIF95930.1 cyclic-di-AMP receptor [Caminicella sporogenes]